MPAFRAGTVRAALARKGPFQKSEAPLGLQPAGTLGLPMSLVPQRARLAPPSPRHGLRSSGSDPEGCGGPFEHLGLCALIRVWPVTCCTV